MQWKQNHGVTSMTLTEDVVLAPGDFVLPMVDSPDAVHGVASGSTLPEGLSIHVAEDGTQSVIGATSLIGAHAVTWGAVIPGTEEQEAQELVTTLTISVMAARLPAADPPPAATLVAAAEEQTRKPFRSVYEASEQAFQDDLAKVHTLEEEIAEVDADLAAIGSRRETLLAKLDQEEAALASQRETKAAALKAQAAKTLDTLDTLQSVQSQFRSKYTPLAGRS